MVRNTHNQPKIYFRSTPRGKQTNIVHDLTTRLDEAKGQWVHELQSVLWAYRTTSCMKTKEIPYSLVYGLQAILPLELIILKN